MPLTLSVLSPSTWAPYAELIERHNGVFGGCWCIGFHSGPNPWTLSPDERREAKAQRVAAGQAHAGLVLDGETCVGWCQFGRVDELTRIKNRKAYEAELATLPDWRITCFFVDKTRRKQGIAGLALQAALNEMVRLGGGIVEAYPEDVADKKVPTMALHAGTLGLFAANGFKRQRKIGKNKWVVAALLPAPPSA